MRHTVPAAVHTVPVAGEHHTAPVVVHKAAAAGRTDPPEEVVDRTVLVLEEVADHTVPDPEEAVDHTVPVPGEGMEAVAGRTGLEGEHHTGQVVERRIGPVPGVRRRVVVRLGVGRRIGPEELHTVPAVRHKEVVRQPACFLSHPWYRSSSRWRQE